MKADEDRDMDWQDMTQPLKLILLGSGILLTVKIAVMLRMF